MGDAAILCVDDNDGILLSLGEQLQRELGDRYEIILARSGEEALEIIADLQAETVDIPLILSDQTMPGMSGDQFLVQSHGLLPQTLKILLTGEQRVEAVRKALNQANLYRYITKPWDETDLLLTVKEALRSYRQQQQLQDQQQQLAQSLSTLEATLEATADGILVLNRSGDIVHFNHRLAQLLGIGKENHSERNSLLSPIRDHLQQSPELWSILCTPMEGSCCQDIELATSEGSKHFECCGQPQKISGKITGQVWSFRDVTDRKQAEALIHYQAQHDSLTGLANRAQFDQYLAEQLRKAQQCQSCLAILFIDLDRFKSVNDNLGHQVGDALLCQVVERLKKCSRQQDLIARWGGDEFTLVLSNLSHSEDACMVIKRILDVLQPEFEIGEHRLHATASIGMAIYPDDGTTAESLLKHADAALYDAKAQGRNCYSRFTTELSQESNRFFVLDSALRRALERQEFMMYYQPQWDMQSQRVTHVEALMRWYTPEQGWISPEEFIPIAEKNGLIITLGEWALWETCRQAQAWRSPHPISISVNLSPRQLLHPQFVATVTQVLAETGLASEQLELEITESVALDNLELSRNRLLELQRMGIKIALDDFGTGYASLSYLKTLPLDTLKIDQSFIQELLHDGQDQAIVQAILTLAEGLNLRVVAEGVETEAIAQQLTRMGCQALQGYWFSRPLPAAETPKFFQQHLKVF